MKARITPHFEIRMGLLQYGSRFKQKNPNLSMLQENDELRQLKWQHGVRRFPPKKKHFLEHQRALANSAGIAEVAPFLWVALKDRVKIVNEKAKVAKRLSLKKVKHTNLTGGGKAYSGGEMWITGPQTVVINGCSGRYGPKSAEQLEDIVKVIARSGWKVRSLGWDDEIARPVKYPR